MITPQEIRTVTFDKVMRGYRPEDVDAFLQQVAQDMEQLAAENADKEKKMYILAEKIEEYRRDEDNLKTALLNAQRMGENVIREAKQKAESMLREAGIRADTLTRVANEQVEEQEEELARVKAEVARFKNDILGMYKQHIELLSMLPEEEAPAEEPLEEVEAAQEPQAPAAPAAPVEEAAPAYEPEPAPEKAAEQFPDLAQLYSQDTTPAEEPQANEADAFFGQAFDTEGFAEQSFDAPAPAAVPAADEEAVFQGFKGIKFSD